MSNVVIKVENLGKKYRIRRERREPYVALRDVLTNKIAALGSSLLATGRHLFDANGKLNLGEFRISDVRAPTADRRSSTCDIRSATEAFWALKDVSFEVKRGEVVGIIGRNGAGKSTLLKLLSRITEPTEGSIKIKGRLSSLLEVGTGFHPELTGRENIFLNGAILGMSNAEIRCRFDEIVAFAEVEAFVDTPVKHYSSGMYLRLAFAVAAHLDPEILVVDEVLAVGDARFQKKCLGKMEAVAREGRTILFVSHNMNAVEELCHSIIMLDKGRIHRIGREVRNIINTYVLASDHASRSGGWHNPGNALSNPWFQPLRFELTDDSGIALDMPVRNDARIWVHIEGEINRLDPAMNVGYALYTEQGSLLYWSLTTDGPEAEWPPFKRGKCQLRTQIPPRFLNEGDYRIDLIISLHFREWIVEPNINAPSLLLRIRGGLSDSPYWISRRPGMIAPVLSWLHSQSETAPNHCEGE